MEINSIYYRRTREKRAAILCITKILLCDQALLWDETLRGCIKGHLCCAVFVLFKAFHGEWQSDGLALKSQIYSLKLYSENEPHDFFSNLALASPNCVYCALGDFENIIFLCSIVHDLLINMKNYNSKSINSLSCAVYGRFQFCISSPKRRLLGNVIYLWLVVCLSRQADCKAEEFKYTHLYLCISVLWPLLPLHPAGLMLRGMPGPACEMCQCGVCTGSPAWAHSLSWCLVLVALDVRSLTPILASPIKQLC